MALRRFLAGGKADGTVGRKACVETRPSGRERLLGTQWPSSYAPSLNRGCRLTGQARRIEMRVSCRSLDVNGERGRRAMFCLKTEVPLADLWSMSPVRYVAWIAA